MCYLVSIIVFNYETSRGYWMGTINNMNLIYRLILVIKIVGEENNTKGKANVENSEFFEGT